MKIVTAIDSLKGCLSSAEANRAAAEGIRSCCPEAMVIEIPVSDGGEGWLEAFHAAIGGEIVCARTCDPFGREMIADYLIKGKTAVIEMARANGLILLRPEERDVERAHSGGTGRLIVDAFRRGCKEIIVGLGGSATCDYGSGMMKAMKEALAPKEGWRGLKMRVEGIRFVAATDVRNPLLGPNGAARVFAPQKGASPEVVERCEKQGQFLVNAAVNQMGFDYSEREGAGAAGGLGWAMMQYLDAECVSGAEVLLDRIGFDEIVQGADLVITGEGSSDCQTLMGKLPFVIMQRAKSHGVPTCLIAGQVKDRQSLIDAGFSDVRCINPHGLSITEAMQKDTAIMNIRKTCKERTRASGEQIYGDYFDREYDVDNNVSTISVAPRRYSAS